MNKERHYLSFHNLSASAKWESVLLVFLLFFLTRPYFFWNWYGNVIVEAAVTGITLFLFWRQSEQVKGGKSKLFSFFVVVWLFWMFSEFIRGSKTGLVLYLPYILFGYLPFIKRSYGKVVFNNFVTVYSVLIGLSMISWIAAISGLISPIGTIGDDIDTMVRDQKSYLVYPLTLVSTSVFNEFTRFGGFYDEAGVVGTFGALILTALRFNMKDWRCLIVLISGLLSASMFFYGLVAVYWLAELLFVKRKYNSAIFLFVGILFFYMITKNNEVFSTLIWDRFEWDSNKGGFAGNTREGTSTDYMMERLHSTGELWFGVKLTNRKAFWDEFFGISSIYTTIAMYGVIIVVLYALWLLKIGRYYRISKWDYLLYCFVVMGCMYQRTGLFSVPYAFLYVSMARYAEYTFGPGANNLPYMKRKVLV